MVGGSGNGKAAPFYHLPAADKHAKQCRLLLLRSEVDGMVSGG